MHLSLVLSLFVSILFAVRARAETHTVKFVNQCGFGTPALVYNGENILTGDSYTSNGPFSGIAYLQTGYCNTNGENCTLMEMTLINPTCAGCGSSADISLISPHVYSVETSFAYYNGCDGEGQTCSSPNCSDAAFFMPNDNFVQKECQANDVDLLISFCAEAAELVGSVGSTGSSGTSSSASSAKPTSASSATPSSKPSGVQDVSNPSYTPITSTTPSPIVSPTPTSTGKRCAATSMRKRQANNIPGRFYHRHRDVLSDH